MRKKIEKEEAYERERARKKKERFIKEAKEHWDVTQKIKAERLAKERKDNEAYNNLMFEDDDRYYKDMMKKEQNKRRLRKDLKTQIREKRQFEEDEKERDLRVDDKATGYLIGGEYIDRFQIMKSNHMKELRDQIDERVKKQEEERLVSLNTSSSTHHQADSPQERYLALTAL